MLTVEQIRIIVFAGTIGFLVGASPGMISLITWKMKRDRKLKREYAAWKIERARQEKEMQDLFDTLYEHSPRD